jgi:hypothetical protein
VGVAAGHGAIFSPCRARHANDRVELSERKDAMKGSQKPKKLGKKPAQKTLKERRTAKRAAAKHANRGLGV